MPQAYSSGFRSVSRKSCRIVRVQRSHVISLFLPQVKPIPAGRSRPSALPVEMGDSRSGKREKHSGGYSPGVPPLPIPNREVKPGRADGTAREMRESRSPPFLAQEPSWSMSSVKALFLYARRGVMAGKPPCADDEGMDEGMNEGMDEGMTNGWTN